MTIYSNVAENYRSFKFSLLNHLFTTKDMIGNYEYSHVLFNSNSLSDIIYDVVQGKKTFLFLQSKEEGINLVKYLFYSARPIIYIEENSSFENLHNEYLKLDDEHLPHLIIDKNTFLRLHHYFQNNLQTINSPEFFEHNIIDGKKINQESEIRFQKILSNYFLTKFSQSLINNHSSIFYENSLIHNFTDLIFHIDSTSNTNKNIPNVSLSSSIAKISKANCNDFLRHAPSALEGNSPEVDMFYQLADRTNELFFQRSFDLYLKNFENKDFINEFSISLVLTEAPFQLQMTRILSSVANVIKNSKYSSKQTNLLKKEVFFQDFHLKNMSINEFVEHFQQLRDLNIFTEIEISQNIFSLLKDIYKLKNQKLFNKKQDIFSHTILDSCTDNELKLIDKFNQGLKHPLPIISKVVEKLFSNDETFVEKHKLSAEIFLKDVKPTINLLVDVDTLNKFFPLPDSNRVISSILKNLADSLNMEYVVYNIRETNNLPAHLHSVFTFSEKTMDLPFEVNELFLREKLLLLTEKTFSSGIGNQSYKDIYAFHKNIAHELILNLMLESHPNNEPSIRRKKI